MAIFSRRRHDVDDRPLQGAAPEGADTDGADDALRQIEAWFTQLASPSSSPAALPGDSTTGGDASVSAARHVSYGDSQGLPPFAAGAVQDEDLVDVEEAIPVSSTDEPRDIGDPATRGGLRRSSAPQTSSALPTAPALSTVDAAETADAAESADAALPAEVVSTADAIAPERDDETGHNGTEEERVVMANLEQAVQDLLAIDGATGVAIVDSGSGMALAQGGHPGFDLEIAAAGNSNVVRAKLQTMAQLGLTGRIDDILITLDEQYHLINVLSGPGKDGLFVYLVLDRAKANLALARHKLTGIAGQLEI